ARRRHEGERPVPPPRGPAPLPRRRPRRPEQVRRRLARPAARRVGRQAARAARVPRPALPGLPATVSAVTPSDVPVFVLCGGLGTRLKEETEFRPKPMVPIGDEPILAHILRTYRQHGFERFVLCLGFKAEVIEEAFADE